MKNKKILLVEDDDGLRNELRLLLAEEGYEVFDSSDGETALKVLQGNPIDLMITDILMPNVDGIELLMEVSHSHPDLLVIAISGGGRTTMRTGQLDYLDMARRLGPVKAILPKPFSSEALIETIEKILAT